MSYLLGKYITDEGLKSIKDHKYKPGAYSSLDNILNPFWIAVSHRIPKWMAPNTVTLLGLIVLLLSYLCMAVYDMSLSKQIPSWPYFVMAIGIFIFQTLDAVDGKHARNTNSSSPLGQLFDHGCDALSWTLTNLSVVTFLQLGLGFGGILAMVASQAPFYLTNLLEHYTGVYEYSTANIDGTSGQMLMIFFNLVPFMFGSGVYGLLIKDVFFFFPEFMKGDYIIRDYAMIIVIYVGVLYSIILMFYILRSSKSAKELCMSTLQIAQHFICYVIIYNYNKDIVFIKENALLMYISVAFVYALITTKLIICSMAKMYFSPIHYEYLVFVPYFYVQSLYVPSPEWDLYIKVAFFSTLLAIGTLYFRFVQVCINQISIYLNIYCFTLGPRKPKEE